ncbi:hypothetical protein [Halobacillus kuroshimensis]|uniref:hypothetical protein n=1 Tax=Halobacillus kuroshimensis TaxID=302481 RepID=UPI001F5D9180|nr:hypothetical protein [Halobacillus kuroshimensis]
MADTKKSVRSWVLYNFGNSASATTIVAAVLPVFYYDVAAKGVQSLLAASYWGYSQSAAVLIVALPAPFPGAVSNYTASKKRFFMFFVLKKGSGPLAPIWRLFGAARSRGWEAALSQSSSLNRM